MKKTLKNTLKHLTQFLLIFAILLIGFWLRLEYAGEVDTGFSIAQSVRFNDDDSAYFNRTFTTPTDGTKSTWSGWVKKSDVRTTSNGRSSVLSMVNGGGVIGLILSRDASNQLGYFKFDGATVFEFEYTSIELRDPSAWHHVVYSLDTTQAATTDRFKIYVDGVERSTTISLDIAQNSTQLNNSGTRYIGHATGAGSKYLDGYLSETYFIDGQALTPSDFGETDTNGYWRPKAYSGTYGTNGYHLNFADSADLGNDVSGNANDWTSNNLDATDQVIDTPTNSFATLNPLDNSGTLSNGDLNFVSGSGTKDVSSTMYVSSGKWYWEFTPTAINIVSNSSRHGAVDSETGNYAYFRDNGNGMNRGTNLSGDTILGGARWVNGTTYAYRLDLDAGTLALYTADTLIGTQTLPVGTLWSPYILAEPSTWMYNFGANAQTGLTYYAAAGGHFKYEPPTGFKALSTNNLPAPAIEQPNQYFAAKTYSGIGDGSLLGWTAQTGAGSRDWNIITSSADGTKLVAGDFSGYIYTSTDSGTTWTEQTGSGSRDWFRITSSADGTKLAATLYGGDVGYVYTSTDSGVTWTEQTGSGSRNWWGISSSADGAKLVAVNRVGYIYTSIDSGVTWTEQTNSGAHIWESVTSSADGTKLAAGGSFAQYIYTSTDSGATWTERTAAGSRDWKSITSSADGVNLAAVVNGGYIYTSTDSGATWTEQTGSGSRTWYSITSSSDVAAVLFINNLSVSGAVVLAWW